MKNDKFDSVNTAKLGLNPNIKKSLIPDEFVLNLRVLCREYYSLANDRTALINKLGGYVRLAFPAFIGIFSDIAGDTSLAVRTYAQSLDHLLYSPAEDIIDLIAKTARKGKGYAANKCNVILQAATISKSISMRLPNAFHLIHSVIKHISLIDEQMADRLQYSYGMM